MGQQEHRNIIVSGHDWPALQNQATPGGRGSGPSERLSRTGWWARGFGTVLAWGLFLVVVAHTASAEPAKASIVTAGTHWSVSAAHVGDSVVMAVVLEVGSGYHINPDREQLDDRFLIPTELEVAGARRALAVGPVRYPEPHDVTVGPVDQPRQVRGYEGRTVLYMPVQVTDVAQTGFHDLDLRLTYQACNRTQCLPPVTLELKATLEVVEPAIAVKTTEGELFDSFREPIADSQGERVSFDVLGLEFSVRPSSWLGLAVLLAAAALGGLLLNFTPCVLPVIPLKMMGLSRAAGQRWKCLALGVSMSLGVVAFWLVLGGVIAGGVKGITATNELFQHPWFTIAVGILIAVMATGTFGAFTVHLPRWVYTFDPRQDTLSGSFGLGVLAAVLATPCTAPFMGAAAAWAATQHPLTTLATFVAIGCGMAVPYLLLSAYPWLVERMPRSGPGSELIKQVMGLLLLAAAAYFLGVGVAGLLVRVPDPPTLYYWWPVAGIVAVTGVWLAVQTMKLSQSSVKRWLFMSLGALMVVGSVYGGFRLTDRGPIGWVYFTPDRLSEALSSDKVVVMDFTAEWCLNCKWLEKTVLHQPAVVRLLNGDDVVAMKVDLTGRNEAGSQQLRSTGRLAIPLLCVFAADGREVFKSDFYTAGQVIDAVDRARTRLGVASP